MLTTAQPTVDLLTIYLETGRKTLEDRGQTGSMGLPTRQQTQFSHASVIRGPRQQSKTNPGHGHENRPLAML